VLKIESAIGIAAASSDKSASRPESPTVTPAVLPTLQELPEAVVVHRPPTVEPAEPATPRDLESLIGSHWLNRAGIAAVLIGVAYFLKFAFENNWIGPAGRITIGLLAGIAVVLWSERFRSRGYKVFSYSLKAVGIGVLYLSLWAGFQVYSLVPSGVAFVSMLAVTAATAAMALGQDAEILAAFALVGGFVTPLLLSSGQNREVALFSYVALLDLATLGMMVFKPWRRLLAMSFAGTVALYVGWYFSFYGGSELHWTIGFATLFFAVFAVAPLVTQKSSQAAASDWVLLPLAFVNAGFYFLTVYGMLVDVSQADAAWFALALALVYIFLSRQTQARYTNVDLAQKQRLLHLALAIGFITIAIPIRLDAHWITLGWFVEAAVLLWVADRIHSDLLNAFALTALVLGIIRLLAFDNFYSSRLLFNPRMATYAVAIAVLGAVSWYGAKRKERGARGIAGGALIALNLLALTALGREISDYFARQMVWENFRRVEIMRDFAYSALSMLYGAGLMAVGFWRRSGFVRWQALVLIAATTAKVFVYDTSALDRVYRILSFIALGVLLLAVSFVYQSDWLKLSSKEHRSLDRAKT